MLEPLRLRRMPGVIVSGWFEALVDELCWPSRCGMSGDW